jgi:hypothetical protein
MMIQLIKNIGLPDNTRQLGISPSIRQKPIEPQAMGTMTIDEIQAGEYIMKILFKFLESYFFGLQR